MWQRQGLVALALLAALGTGPVAAAAGPSFAYGAASEQAHTLPAGPARFSVFARVQSPDGIASYGVSLAAGETETIGLVILAGAPTMAITVISPTGNEATLPYLPQPQAFWLGPIRLQRIVAYPFRADVAGVYGLAVQAAIPGQRYAIEGNVAGGFALGAPGIGSFLAAPVTLAQTLFWIW